MSTPIKAHAVVFVLDWPERGAVYATPADVDALLDRFGRQHVLSVTESTNASGQALVTATVAAMRGDAGAFHLHAMACGVAPAHVESVT